MSIADPRDVAATSHAGHVMRDAAVTPNAKDFLAPTNAGVEGPDGNPHGPTVVSPGIHALGEVHPVTPGPVSSDLAVQEAEELEHLAESQPQTVLPEGG